MQQQNCKKRIYLFIFGFLFLFSSVTVTHAEPLRIGFLCPKPPESGFWSQVIQPMQSAAKDLDIELLIRCDSSASTFGTRRTGDMLLKSEPKLNYLITGYWATVTKYHLALAKERGIKVFIFNADIKDVERAEIGVPRGIYKNWIGHMMPADQAAAMELTELLVDLAMKKKQKSLDKKVNVYGFIGEGFSTVTQKRNTGLFNKIKAMPIAHLREEPLEFWKVDRAKQRARELVASFSQIDVIWAGSQNAMWGAVQGVEQAGKIPGKDVFIGGFDWNSESIEAIADGRISASMFGHFMEGVWALLLVHDYHHGIDFINDVGVQIHTPMSAMTPQNYEHYKVILAENYWQNVDFKKLSKKHNPAIKAYNFDISQFLDK